MPAPSTLLGALAGMVLSLSVALIVVMAANGRKNPGMGGAEMMQSAASGASAPLPHQDPDRDSFTSLDLNGDGRLSLAEAAGNAEIVTRFDRADRNRDGKLTQVELNRLAKLPPPKPKTKVTQRTIRRDAATAPAN